MKDENDCVKLNGDLPLNEVSAVKDVETIRDISRYLVKHFSQREADIWNFGINTALRISDLLNIRFDDIQGDTITLKEAKTGKTRKITLNNTALRIIKQRKADHPSHVFLFQATSRNVGSTLKPVSRQHAASALRAVGTIVGVHLSTHSMRKTRGYHLWKNGTPLEVVAKMLNHSGPAVTMRYIGLDAETIRDTYSMEL